MSVVRYPAAGAWHTIGATGEPAFANSWVAYGSGLIPPAFRKDRDNMVTLVGMLAKGGGNWAVETILTLPVGFRPGYAEDFNVAVFGAAGGRGRVKVDTAGVVTVQEGAAANPVNFLSFAGIQFYASN